MHQNISIAALILFFSQRFFVLADYASYVQCQEEVSEVYQVWAYSLAFNLTLQYHWQFLISWIITFSIFNNSHTPLMPMWIPLRSDNKSIGVWTRLQRFNVTFSGELVRDQLWESVSLLNLGSPSYLKRFDMKLCKMPVEDSFRPMFFAHKRLIICCPIGWRIRLSYKLQHLICYCDAPLAMWYQRIHNCNFVIRHPCKSDLGCERFRNASTSETPCVNWPCFAANPIWSTATQ